MRILLAERPGLFRDTLHGLVRWELEGHGDNTAEVETAETVSQARETASSFQPEIILISMELPTTGGISAIEVVARVAPEGRIVLVAEEGDHLLLMRAVRAGAIGFVARRDQTSDLRAAVSAAARGLASIPPSMLRGVLRRAAGCPDEPDEPSARVERLTDRERQVLTALAAGIGNRALGEILGISPHTARTHVQNLLPKLGVHSRLEAAAIARRSGLLARSDGEVA